MQIFRETPVDPVSKKSSSSSSSQPFKPLLADGLHNLRHALWFWATLIHWLLPTSSMLSLHLFLCLPLTRFPCLGVHSDVILAHLVLLILATCPVHSHAMLSIISFAVFEALRAHGVHENYINIIKETWIRKPHNKCHDNDHRGLKLFHWPWPVFIASKVLGGKYCCEVSIIFQQFETCIFLRWQL